jgi:hypothetical protein
MANQYASGKTNLVEPPLGSYVNSWNVPNNSNFGLTAAAVSGTTTIDASTLTPGVPFVVLAFQTFEQNPTPQTNPLAGQNLRIRITGSLSFDVSVLIPSGVPGFWFIDNQTSGNYSVNVKTTDPLSTGIQPLQGYMSIIFCDGTNVLSADLGTIKAAICRQNVAVETGSIILYSVSTVPFGYLACNGAAVSRITYADLFTVIGVTYGAGDGTSTFNLPTLTSPLSAGIYMIKT